MSVQNAQTTVTTTPTRIDTPDLATDKQMDAGFLGVNRGAVSIFVGKQAGLTSSTGVEVLAGQSFAVQGLNSTRDPLYAVTASGTCRVDVLQVGS